VVIGVSSHGYADPAGRFRFVLAGQGNRESSTASVQQLRGTLSTDDLANALQHVDAGQLVLIVDACQSEATVAADGFKPGPMGSRGLGQLAYDKGMRVLAASRSQEVAIEIGGPIKQGLLSFALVREGLERRQADFKPHDGVIRVGEWLAYAVEAVPRLFSEGEAESSIVATGEPAGTRHGFLGAGRTAHRYQQPVLFDFARRDVNILVLH
jgi:hypothetical protein